VAVVGAAGLATGRMMTTPPTAAAEEAEAAEVAAEAGEAAEVAEAGTYTRPSLSHLSRFLVTEPLNSPSVSLNE